MNSAIMNGVFLVFFGVITNVHVYHFVCERSCMLFYLDKNVLCCYIELDIKRNA